MLSSSAFATAFPLQLVPGTGPALATSMSATVSLCMRYPADATQSGYSLWIGAKTREAMAFLRPVIDKGWDHVEM